ncbi:MAG: hypothetical protein R3B72_39810 [Polyangiaceae bacterium]
MDVDASLGAEPRSGAAIESSRIGRFSQMTPRPNIGQNANVVSVST